MTLADLLTALETQAALPASRAKDMKTSLRYLAAALGQASPEQCSVDDTCRDPATWTTLLESHFQALAAQGRAISAATRRNTRNNLRVVFRLAEDSGLLTAPLPSRLLDKPRREVFRLQAHATAPYRETYRPQSTPRHYGLPQAQWPPDIAQGWRDYRSQCPIGRRETTFRAHAHRLENYIGYLLNIAGRTPTWDALFAVAPLAEFVRWHGARFGRVICTHGHAVVQTVGAIAVILKHPNARQIADFRNDLPQPVSLHEKEVHHWVSLDTLDAVADACIAEARIPVVVQSRVRHPGLRGASAFQRGVMLKLLRQIPLRQRNVRELRLGRNLTKDHEGHWRLRFSGDELKIGMRRGKVNEFTVDLTDYCPDFIPVLEEFLQVFRPRLPNAKTSPFLFLTSVGTPYTTRALHAEIAENVQMRTGQRFYPHLIRTIWATEFLEDTQDYATAATMLGDTIEVVMSTYYHLDQKEHHAKARAWRDGKRHTG
jgi:hypothetical protein